MKKSTMQKLALLDKAKCQHPDKLVLLYDGRGYYEMFGDDAQIVAGTTRVSLWKQCGVPYVRIGEHTLVHTLPRHFTKEQYIIIDITEQRL